MTIIDPQKQPSIRPESGSDLAKVGLESVSETELQATTTVPLAVDQIVSKPPLYDDLEIVDRADCTNEQDEDEPAWVLNHFNRVPECPCGRPVLHVVRQMKTGSLKIHLDDTCGEQDCPHAREQVSREARQKNAEDFDRIMAQHGLAGLDPVALFNAHVEPSDHEVKTAEVRVGLR
jgi:hypothetical protein